MPTSSPRIDRNRLPDAATVSGGASAQNAFTVDLEEWFHICGVGGPLAVEHWDHLPSRVVDTTHRVLALLASAGVVGTFFVVGWVADRHPGLVEEIVRAGHEVGSHSYFHRRVFELTPDQFRDDLRASVKALKALTPSDVRLYRAPEWSINRRSLWALDILREEQFRLDASMAPLRLVGDTTFPRYPHHRRTPSGVILEVPPLVADRFGQVMPMGWGWGLRMSSPSRVLRAVERENRAGRPAVFTLHPWEIDPEPPRITLPPGLRFAHYFRLSGFEERLRIILRSGVPFGPISLIQSSREAE